MFIYIEKVKFITCVTANIYNLYIKTSTHPQNLIQNQFHFMLLTLYYSDHHKTTLLGHHHTLKGTQVLYKTNILSIFLNKNEEIQVFYCVDQHKTGKRVKLFILLLLFL